MTTTITLRQDAYITSGQLRLAQENGKPSIYVLTDWYQATATDAAGNDYIVYWDIANTDTDDDIDACDWHNPILVTDADGTGIVGNVIISW